MPICIAGMHRSGTSMVTRLLNLGGVFLGEESKLMGPSVANPEGYWEHMDFYNLNNDVLARLGCGWDLPPATASGWEHFPVLDDLFARARELVHSMDRFPVWGWKDPRNSITLPFWQSVIPDLQVVICIRNPLEVAKSLTKRGWSSTLFGLNLWKIYNRRALAALPRDRCVVTHYERYFGDAPGELRRVLGLLNLTASDQAIEQACATIEPSLYHHSNTVEELIQAGAPDDIVQLYKELCALAAPELGFADSDPSEPKAEDTSDATGTAPVRVASSTPAASRELELRTLLLDVHEQLWKRDEMNLLLCRRFDQVQSDNQALREQIRQMRATRVWRLGEWYWRAHAQIRQRFGA